MSSRKVGGVVWEELIQAYIMEVLGERQAAQATLSPFPSHRRARQGMRSAGLLMPRLCSSVHAACL